MCVLCFLFLMSFLRSAIVILADDLGYGDTSVYGSTYYTTPNIDALAARGVRFVQAYGSGSVCSPSRVSILTGRYPHRVQLTNFLGYRDRGGGRALRTPQIGSTYWYRGRGEWMTPALLTGMVERTAHVGKWHVWGEPAEFGFDDSWATRWPGNHDDAARNLTDAALAFIGVHARHRFFLSLCHFAPHWVRVLTLQTLPPTHNPATSPHPNPNKHQSHRSSRLRSTRAPSPVGVDTRWIAASPIAGRHRPAQARQLAR